MAQVMTQPALSVGQTGTTHAQDQGLRQDSRCTHDPSRFTGKHHTVMLLLSIDV